MGWGIPTIGKISKNTWSDEHVCAAIFQMCFDSNLKMLTFLLQICMKYEDVNEAPGALGTSNNRGIWEMQLEKQKLLMNYLE